MVNVNLLNLCGILTIEDILHKASFFHFVINLIARLKLHHFTHRDGKSKDKDKDKQQTVSTRYYFLFFYISPNRHHPNAHRHSPFIISCYDVCGWLPVLLLSLFFFFAFCDTVAGVLWLVVVGCACVCVRCDTSSTLLVC